MGNRNRNFREIECLHKIKRKEKTNLMISQKINRKASLSSSYIFITLMIWKRENNT